jgi:hypothetical protein
MACTTLKHRLYLPHLEFHFLFAFVLHSPFLSTALAKYRESWMRFWESPKPFWHKICHGWPFPAPLLAIGKTLFHFLGYLACLRCPLCPKKEICVACLALIQDTLALNSHAWEAV